MTEASESVGPPALRRDLERIGAQIEATSPEVYRRLQPGLSREKARKQLRAFPGQLPDEVYTLYAWRNGARGRQRLELMPGYHFLSAQQAVRLYRQQLRLARKVAGESRSRLWHPSWFPLFEMDGKEWLIVRGSEEPAAAAPLERLFIEDGEPQAVYDSLQALCAELAEAYESGAVILRSDGLAKSDGEAAAAIRRRFRSSEADTVLAALEADPTSAELSQQMSAILELRDPRYVPPLIHLLSSEASDLDQQRYAAAMLGMLEDRRAAEPLLLALERVHPTVQASVAVALGRLSVRRAAEPLLRLALESHNVDARCAAIGALGTVGTEAQLRSLEPILETAPPLQLRMRLMEVLSRRGIGEHQPVDLGNLRNDPALQAQIRAEIEAETDPLRRQAREQAFEMLQRYGDLRQGRLKRWLRRLWNLLLFRG